MSIGEYAGGLQLAYENQIRAADAGLAQAIKTEQFPGENYIDAALRVAQSYILADSQRRLLSVQLQRAQQGLAPLDSGQIGLGVNVGLSPETIKNVAMWGLGGLAIFLLLKKAR